MILTPKPSMGHTRAFGKGTNVLRNPEESSVNGLPNTRNLYHALICRPLFIATCDNHLVITRCKSEAQCFAYAVMDPTLIPAPPQWLFSKDE